MGYKAIITLIMLQKKKIIYIIYNTHTITIYNIFNAYCVGFYGLKLRIMDVNRVLEKIITSAYKP